MARYNLKIIRKWVRALESGNYKQTSGALCRREGGKPSYCCLGVLARVQGKRFDSGEAFKVGNDFYVSSLPVSLLAGMSGDQQSKFIRMNDTYGYSFKQIAKHARRLFLQPKKKKSK